MPTPTGSTLLERATIEVPCKMDWDVMRGDERTRHCGSCKLDVHNLSAMTRAEGEALLRNRSGRLCVRLYRRPDGTVITQDCRTVLARAGRRMRLWAAAIVGALGLTTAGALAADGRADPQPVAPNQTVPGPVRKLSDVLRDFLAPQARPTTGVVACPPPAGTHLPELGKIAVNPQPGPLMGEVAVEELGDVPLPEDPQQE